MKKIFNQIILLLFASVTQAQTVGVGTASPHASAQLDVSSNSRGFLPPRMTLTNRNSIGSPAAGLMIYCSNCGVYGQLQIYNGLIWTNMSDSPASGPPMVGDVDGGGIVAYILQSGDPGYVGGEIHGLIAAPSDQSTNAMWGCYGTEITGADGTALGTGNQNTIDILAGCSTAGIAARLCGNLVLGGYNDWYLPSKDELAKLYMNRTAIGGFSGTYWSSSEYSNNEAWVQRFIDGSQPFYPKNDLDSDHVRAIRAF